MSSRWTRRGALALGALAVGAVASPVQPASADVVSVGDLRFEPPSGLRPVRVEAGTGWQWRGEQRGVTGYPRLLVLARADLASDDADEILSVMIAGAAAGQLPGLTVGNRQTRTMPGGGDQVRIPVSYAVSEARRYSGTLLIATTPAAAVPLPAAVLAIFGDNRLTAGLVNTVLDSARWER